MSTRFLLSYFFIALFIFACSEDGEEVIPEVPDQSPPSFVVDILANGKVDSSNETTAEVTVGRDGFTLSVEMKTPAGFASAKLGENDLTTSVSNLIVSADGTSAKFDEVFYIGYSGDKINLTVTDKKQQSSSFIIDPYYEVNLAPENIKEGNWSLISDDKGEFIEQIFVTSDNSLLLIDAGKLFKSTDNGASGTLISTPGLGSAGKIKAHPSGDLYLTGFFSSVLLKSTDNGSTWSQVSTNLPSNVDLWDLEITPNGKFYASMFSMFSGPGPNGGVWVSDNGESWTLETDFLNNQNVREIGIIDDNILLAGTDFPNGNIFLSTDAGKSWEAVSNPKSGPNSIRSILTAKDGKIYIGSTSGLLFSEDGGKSFATLDQGLPIDMGINLIYEGTDGEIYACPSDYGVFELAGSSWKSIGTDLAPYNIPSMAILGGKLHVIAHPQKLYKLE